MKILIVLIWAVLAVLLTLINGLWLPVAFGFFGVDSSAATALVIVNWILSALAGAIGATIMIFVASMFIGLFGFGRGERKKF